VPQCGQTKVAILDDAEDRDFHLLEHRDAAAGTLELALRHQVPDISPNKAWAEAGSLMSYAPDLTDVWRRAVVCVQDRPWPRPRLGRRGDLPKYWRQLPRLDVRISEMTARRVICAYGNN
jgi:hypothetical protein